MSTRAEEGMEAGFKLKLAMFKDQVVTAADINTISTMKSRGVRDDDIYLCTYPKSGAHWTWEIINMITAGQAEYAKHWLRSSHIDMGMEEDFETISSPRILSSHHRPSILPRQIWERKCRVINVQRNPKDVAVSYYNNLTNQDWLDKSKDPSFTGSWENFMDAFIKGNLPYDSVLDHMLAWNKFPEDYPDVPFLQVHFEELKRNNVEEIKRLAEFLNRPLSDKVYEEISDACSFSELKQASKHKDPTHLNPWRDGSSGLFSRGETGDWKNWFTVAQSERFDKMYEEKCHRPFPY
ncbi:sulfotransferase 1B1-like [Haliotis rufescens]|uniref:sulfotransferase 1B1-like n=1 Tax=Haliotis rufescens TaxID=6454 RepID=UPI00201F8D05|nr:sulfotransferase 1B1-like [Haliotis rufescens]